MAGTVPTVFITLEVIAQDYILNCKIEGKSQKTISNYEMVIEKFIWYCCNNDFPEVSEITAMHIRRFLYYLQTEPNRWGNGKTNKPASRTTVNDYYRALHTFFNWIEREKLISENPFTNIKAPKVENKIIQALSENEIEILFKQCSNNIALHVRNKAILAIMIDCGLRVSELTSLTMSDIDLETGSISVQRGKGGKQRIVRIGLKARQALQRYIVYYRKSTNDRVFINRTDKPLDIKGIKILIIRLGQKAGIHVHSHKLRHTFAINYLRNGGDVFSLQYLLGHSTLHMTLRYVQSLNSTDAAKAHQKYSPLDNFGISYC